jgi:hypothetical protein
MTMPILELMVLIIPRSERIRHESC